MLAMRFEDGVFNAATSLADYRKKLAKRLKKLQKNYRASPKPPSNNASASSGSTQSEKLQELKVKYGESLLFICKYAPQAIATLKEKHGSDRASHLQQHTDNAKQWATDLGLISSASGTKRKLDAAALERLQTHLKQRVDNIRSHVVKMTQPDLFLQETLEKLESSSDEKTSSSSTTTNNTLARAMKRRLHALGWKDFDRDNLLTSLETAMKTVPPPTRELDSQLRSALVHLETMRAASQALLAFLALQEQDYPPQLPKDVMTKCHHVAVEGINYLQEVTKKFEKKASTEIKLDDAWTKVMELPPSTEEDVTDLTGPPAAKRQRTSLGYYSSIKSRALLTAGRPCPSNLVQALRRKQATLVLRQGNEAAHLVLDFGKAFTMTVYLTPLVVRIRAMPRAPKSEEWEAPHLQHGVIQERLEYAEAHATKTLRDCFGAAHDKPHNSDFEVEISEATALLQFLQLARQTYVPHWKDAEIIDVA